MKSLRFIISPVSKRLQRVLPLFPYTSPTTHSLVPRVQGRLFSTQSTTESVTPNPSPKPKRNFKKPLLLGSSAALITYGLLYNHARAEEEKEDKEKLLSQAITQIETGDKNGWILLLEVCPEIAEAIGAIRKEDLKGFMGIFNKLVQKEPQLEYYYLLIAGIILLQSSNPFASLEIITKAIQSNPTDPLGYFIQGDVLIDLGRSEEALLSYNQAVTYEPKHAIAYHAYYNRRVALRRMGRFEEALASSDEAIALKPNDVKTHYDRGVILSSLNRLEEALESYNKAIAYEPNYVSAYVNRAAVLANLGRFEEALASCDEAIARKPTHAGAYYNQGNIFTALDRPTEALLSYQTAILYKPDDVRVYVSQGSTLARLGRFKEALESYSQAIYYKPDLYQPYMGAGIVFSELGAYAYAKQCFEEAINKLTPDQLPAKQLIEANLAITEAYNLSSVEAWQKAAASLKLLEKTASLDRHHLHSVSWETLAWEWLMALIGLGKEESYRKQIAAVEYNAKLLSTARAEEQLLAAQRGDGEAVKLKKGANADLIALPTALSEKEDTYETDLIAACRLGHTDAAIALLEKYTPVSKKEVEAAIEDCHKRLHFDFKEDNFKEDRARSRRNNMLLDIKIGELLKFDVLKIRLSPGILYKYQGHLDNVEGVVIHERNQIPMVGWHIHYFLALHARFYLETLAGLKMEALRKKGSSHERGLLSREQEQIKKEFLLMLETASVFYIGTKIAEGFRCNNNISKKQKQAVIDAYIAMIAKRIQGSSHEYSLASGYPGHVLYPGHAFYINFLKHKRDNALYTRIDNLGELCDRHLIAPQSDTIYPCFFKAFPGNDEEKLKAYLMEIFSVRHCYEPREKGVRSLMSSLLKGDTSKIEYVNVCHPKKTKKTLKELADLLYLEKCSRPHDIPGSPKVSREKQQVSNCVTENYFFGKINRFAQNKNGEDLQGFLWDKEKAHITRLSSAERYKPAHIEPPLIQESEEESVMNADALQRPSFKK